MEQQLIERKNLESLSQWESERFWSCMIYVHLMPPKEKHATTGENLRETEVYHNSEGMRDYKPINRYDEFVSSHASCCEHTTNYFGHYHRHLLILYELSLNEADQSLRNR